MATVQTSPEQRFALGGVSWRSYERLLRAFEERHVRITYDRGNLELMTLSPEHECYKRLLNRLVEVLTEEMALPLAGFGSMTFKRRKRRRGLEADECYWIANEPKVHGKIHIDLKTDPPPDLVIEIDISKSSIDRMDIYALLKVPEVWQFDGFVLLFHILGSDGRYTTSSHSLAFPQVTATELARFLALRGQMDENAIARQFRAWVRQQGLGGGQPPVVP